MPSGFKRDRLIEPGEPGGRAAFAVDDRDVPTELLASFLDVDAVEMRNVVLFVAGEEDDLLAGLGLRRLGRPLPGRLRSGVLCDRRLGVGHGVGEGRQARQNTGKGNGARGYALDTNSHCCSPPNLKFYACRPLAQTLIVRRSCERTASFRARYFFAGARPR